MSVIPRNIAILGEGITGKAVVKKLAEFPDVQITNNLDLADSIVISPGIPPAQYAEHAEKLISEIDLAYLLMNRKETKYCPKIIAVTGTNGKTTVTSMISHVLDCPAAGNIGTTLIELVDNPPRRDTACCVSTEFISLELSSYQLETTKYLRPKVSLLLNITEDHLARHGTMEEYTRVKEKVFANSELNIKPKDLINPPHFDLQIPGKHNQANAYASYLSCEAVGLSDEDIRLKLKTFPGVEHRIEFVKELDGVKFYNDSKATNPDATEIAITALDDNIILILGGSTKNSDYSHMSHFIFDKKVKQVIIIGETTPEIKSALDDVGYTNYRTAENMLDAITKAYQISQIDDKILLSPACASFDMYKNFEERGKHFKECVLNHLSK